jgi:hypothetical protein
MHWRMKRRMKARMLMLILKKESFRSFTTMQKASQLVNILFHKTAVGVKLLQVEKMPACPVYGMFFVMCVFLFSEVLDLVGRAVVNQTLLSP